MAQSTPLPSSESSPSTPPAAPAEPPPLTPHSISSTIPSSFDSSPEFLEPRMTKFLRRIKEEPLIPLGCLATCYALYQATKSIRQGDHHKTNRMFRARIYAQGFTLLALVGGSLFWKDDRMKRRELEKALEAKRSAEKREKWLKELEERDREEREWRGRFEGVAEKGRGVKEMGGWGKDGAARQQGKRRKEEGVKGEEGVVRKVEEGLKKVVRKGEAVINKRGERMEKGGEEEGEKGEEEGD